ncbi:MAG TPA: hypothetical protein VJA94_17245 [Candidatus Angelobacter sp.]
MACVFEFGGLFNFSGRIWYISAGALASIPWIHPIGWTWPMAEILSAVQITQL